MPNYGHLSLSCTKIERPSPLEKLPSQTPHVRFRRRKWVHTCLCSKDRTQGHTRRSRGLLSPGHSAALCCQRNLFYSATLLYTYISRFSVNPHYRQQLYLRPSFIVFFNFLYKRPTFAFTSESGYTLGFPRKIAHNGTHGETGAVSDGALSLPSTRAARSRTSPGRVSERRTLPLLGLGRGCSQRTQRASGQRCAYARRCPEASRPRWAAGYFYFCRSCGLYALRSGPFRVCETRGGITTLSALYVLLKRRTAACQSG